MTNILDLQTQYIPHIRNHLQSGSIVLFTGAGFSLDGINIEGINIPGVEKLNKQIWEICYPEEEFDKSVELQDIFENALSIQPRSLESLLKKSFTVDPAKCPQWYSQLLSIPWLKSYTLNIDDLIEKVYENDSRKRPLSSISAKSDDIGKTNSNNFNVIHLNGTLKDSPYNITFSKTQYAKRIGNDPFYQQLATDLLSRIVIFIGSNLNEGPLWEHIISRGEKGIRGNNELRPRSYLVIPSLNRAKQAMLDKYNIAWIKMTGKQFTEEILLAQKDVFTDGFKALENRMEPGISSRYVFDTVDELIQSNIVGNEFLLGNEPVWDDILSSKVAKRECFDKLAESVNLIRSSSDVSNFIVVTGTAGTGKSSSIMWEAFRLHAEGLKIAWLDKDYKYTKYEFKKSVLKGKYDAIFINNADIYGALISNFIRESIDINPRMIVVLECRSSKVDNIISSYELKGLTPSEFVIPSLKDTDIDSILNVLDRENRLGVLKGETEERRVEIFKQKCNRQLLVAMYEATTGLPFEEKITSELNQLVDIDKVVYALVSVATAFRFNLTKDEILIGCLKTNNETLNSIEKLARRKLILHHNNSYYKARHRVIAQKVFDEIVREGTFREVLKGLLFLSVSQVTERQRYNSRQYRIIKTFINHKFMKRLISVNSARSLYSDFEEQLSWDAHYWLHRGALELEVGNMGKAENFLNQAMSLKGDDLLIQTEWAYYLYRKAIENPKSFEAEDLVERSITMLKGIIARNINMSAHAFHILVSNGLKWVAVGINNIREKEQFLQNLKKEIGTAIRTHDSDSILSELEKNLQRAILELAI